MESCFPPLTGLSLRDNSNSSSKGNKKRHSSNNSVSSGSAKDNDKCTQSCNDTIPSKLEVLQDLDLYYIRQIASSLKVTKTNTQIQMFYFYFYLYFLLFFFSLLFCSIFNVNTCAYCMHWWSLRGSKCMGNSLRCSDTSLPSKWTMHCAHYYFGMKK